MGFSTTEVTLPPKDRAQKGTVLTVPSQRAHPLPRTLCCRPGPGRSPPGLAVLVRTPPSREPASCHPPPVPCLPPEASPSAPCWPVSGALGHSGPDCCSAGLSRRYPPGALTGPLKPDRSARSPLALGNLTREKSRAWGWGHTGIWEGLASDVLATASRTLGASV